jgi:hypothetical protein
MVKKKDKMHINKIKINIKDVIAVNNGIMFAVVSKKTFKRFAKTHEVKNGLISVDFKELYLK